MSIPLAFRRFRLLILTITIVAVLVVSVYAYGFTSFGRPSGTCPPRHWASGNQGPTNVPFNIVASGDQYRPYLGSGTIAWCIYNGSGGLERSYLTNRILGGMASSADGGYLAAVGYKILPGRAGVYSNGAVYLFDSNGQLKWNVSSNREIFSVHINSNGSVIIANFPELLYLNNQGRVVWNYSKYEVATTAIVNDGTNIVAGISQILFPNHVNYGSELVMFDSRGNTHWNYTIPDQIFGGTETLAVSSGHVAAGVESSGYNGTLLYLDLQGSLVWSRHVDSAILNVTFDNGGSAIRVQTNWGRITYNLLGDVISNQETPH